MEKLPFIGYEHHAYDDAVHHAKHLNRILNEVAAKPGKEI
jgi:hypothetical protein